MLISFRKLSVSVVLRLLVKRAQELMGCCVIVNYNFNQWFQMIGYNSGLWFLFLAWVTVVFASRISFVGDLLTCLWGFVKF